MWFKSSKSTSKPSVSKTKESTGSTETIEPQKIPEPSKSLVSAYFPEIKFESLEDVLQQYGSLHPFFVFSYVNTMLCFWLCYLSHTLAGNMIVALSKEQTNTTFCHCPYQEYRNIHYQTMSGEDIVRAERDTMEPSARRAIQWGFYLGHMTLFLAHIYGRRSVFLLSLALNAVMSLTVGTYRTGIYAKFAFVFLHFSIHHMRVSVLVNTIEWMPSRGRLIATYAAYCGMVFGKLTVGVLVYFNPNYFLNFTLIGIISIVVSLPMVFLALHDSPYHLLSINDIYGLQFCFELLEIWKPGCSPGPAEEIVDDVAFAVFERHETFLDTLWASVSNWRIFKEFIVFIVILLALVSVENTLGEAMSLRMNLNLGLLESNIISNIVELLGITAAFLITGRRRGLCIVWSLLLFIVSYSCIQLIPPNDFDLCAVKFDRTGASGVFHTIFSVICQMSHAMLDIMLNLHLLESFPTTIRPHVMGILFTLKVGVFDDKVHDMLEYLSENAQWCPGCGVMALCLVAVAVVLANEYGGYQPMKTYFADLKDKKQNRETHAVSYPLISTVAKKIV